MESNFSESRHVGDSPKPEDAPNGVNPGDLPDVTAEEKRPDLTTAASWTIPSLQLLGENRFHDFDMRSVSHVVLQISQGRQQQVFRQIGVEYDWDNPFPFWHFLGRMLSKAMFNDDSLLALLNYVPVNNYEFVGYVNRDRIGEQEDKDQLNVIEVHLKRPEPNEPIQIHWKPGRGLVIQKIEQWVKEKMPALNVDAGAMMLENSIVGIKAW
ncbi:hypothetical protein NM208_g613 [Fusarium decemcellulare]|uniref:Uncharacterized protein n=1 Tax=Fusarium decemcellulare TaxID=57161 RepID=A0ACC1SZN0_9HYPO|nr:hypothetical protein NM208_g613 [Fusarium decemcellulare]